MIYMLDGSPFDNSFVVELTQKEFLTIGQVLHLRATQPHNELALSALRSLKSQVDGIYLDPKKHHVFDPISAPVDSVEMANAYYIPLLRRKKDIRNEP